MSTEIELKLRLAPKDAPELTRHPALAGLATKKQRLLNTYYDTPELTLHARRVAVRFRKKGTDWLLTVKSAEPAQGGLAVRSEWETPATPGHFEFSHVDHPGLHAELTQARSQLHAIFHTDFRRQTWQVPEGHSLIELALDRGQIESCGRRRPLCEIELELIHGRVADLFSLAQRLQADIDLRPALISKAEQGYRLFTQEPETPFAAPSARVNTRQPPLALYRALALQALEQLQRNETGILTNAAPEFILQAALATRTLLHCTRFFAPLLPETFTRQHAPAWHALWQHLNEHLEERTATAELVTALAATPGRLIERLNKHATREETRHLHTLQAEIASRGYARQVLQFTADVYALP